MEQAQELKNSIARQFLLGVRQVQINRLSETLLYCVCRTPDPTGFMIACDNCDQWFHGDCIGVTPQDSQRIYKYYCTNCQTENSRLATIYNSSYSNRNSQKNKAIKESSEDRPRIPTFKLKLKSKTQTKTKSSSGKKSKRNRDNRDISSRKRYRRKTETNRQRTQRKKLTSIEITQNDTKDDYVRQSQNESGATSKSHVRSTIEIDDKEKTFNEQVHGQKFEGCDQHVKLQVLDEILRTPVKIELTDIDSLTKEQLKTNIDDEIALAVAAIQVFSPHSSPSVYRNPEELMTTTTNNVNDESTVPYNNDPVKDEDKGESIIMHSEDEQPIEDSSYTMKIDEVDDGTIFFIQNSNTLDADGNPIFVISGNPAIDVADAFHFVISDDSSGFICKSVHMDHDYCVCYVDTKEMNGF